MIRENRNNTVSLTFVLKWEIKRYEVNGVNSCPTKRSLKNVRNPTVLVDVCFFFCFFNYDPIP